MQQLHIQLQCVRKYAKSLRRFPASSQVLTVLSDKIEDLAILTGDQAFCSSCFRCRNCKRKIENLRYARTSSGIFCMVCHENLMARRRKRSKGTPKPSQSAAKEKALPSLPPGAAPQSAFSPELETPPSEAQSGTPSASSPPERQSQSRKEIPRKPSQRDASPFSDDARKGVLTDQSDRSGTRAERVIDGLTLPATTYGEPRPSNVSQESDDGDERGFLPMAFDPTPAPGPPPMIARKQVPTPSPPTQNENRSRDYFGRLTAKSASRDLRAEEQRPGSSRSVSTEREPERTANLPKASPHILFQEKGRQRKASENSTPASMSAGASPAVPPSTLQEKAERLKAQQLDTGAQAAKEQEGFKLQKVPESKKAGSRGSPNEARSPASAVEPTFKDERAEKLASQSPVSTDSPSSSINPFDDPKRKEVGGGGTTAVPPRPVDRPVRGDSLTSATRKTKAPTPEVQTPTTTIAPPITEERKGSVSSLPSSFVDAQSTLSRDNSAGSKPIDSPPVRSSFDVPPPPRASSRKNPPSKAVATEDFTAPRAPPAPPPTTVERHKNNDSVGSGLPSSELRSDGALSPTLRSAHLPKHSLDGSFSMEEEMARIMGRDPGKLRQSGTGEELPPSVLRKVSNAVKHGRSFSDRGLRSAGKTSASGPIEISSPMMISSPLLSSPAGKDSGEQLAAQLKRAQLRIAELESEVNRLEDKVNSSHEIKAANNELREKRTTMVVLDTQREMVVRELEAMTVHLAKAKDNNHPLDLNSLKSDILRDFAESLQKLKDQMSAQIEDLMHKRNQLTEEIGNLIQMKDKGFQEYESLSNKNAQLLEMNNQILHNIQDMYKSNRGPNGTAATANGLGISTLR